jgi:formylglycine-generating enzyme required for sulfatase activity
MRIYFLLAIFLALPVLTAQECPCIGDSDGDGQPDQLDNCLALANPDQQDQDGDELGDLCDACPNDPQNDPDQDGICSDLDNCPDDPNHDQTDCDLDGQGDGCDNDPGHCVPVAMVWVPAGPFWRGSCNGTTSPTCKSGEPGYATSGAPDNMHSDETPLRQISLGAYALDTFEVSAGQFADCVHGGACHAANYYDSINNASCNYGNPERLDHPMNCVNWHGAVEYCTFMGKRLPTEAEWEKAARGTTGSKYPWGNQSPDCSFANFYGTGQDCVGATTPVGNYPKGVSPYGAFDMMGNVWEWVADWYGSDYYSSAPASDPAGPATGAIRVLRGGSWGYYAYRGRSAYRLAYDPSFRVNSLGFRCALTRSSQLLPLPNLTSPRHF